MTLRRNLPYARVTSANTSRSAAHRPRRKPRDPRRTSNRGHPQPRRKRQSALVDGFSLHAGVHLHANDREGLEKLCGYGARPPFALERLSVLPDGRVCYRLKRPTADERTELRLAPTEFLRKLASLIPPPRHHLVRFHGVFAPNAAWRKEVVPSLEPAAPQASSAPAATVPSLTAAPAAMKGRPGFLGRSCSSGSSASTCCTANAAAAA